MRVYDFAVFVGETFNSLKVIGIERDENNKPLFRCECSCGQVGTFNVHKVRSGHTKTCGNKDNHENLDKANKLIGQRIAYLEVLQWNKELRSVGQGLVFNCLCHACGQTKPI